MATAHSITTAEQLLAAGDVGPCELVRGELIEMIPPGGEHGRIVTELVFALRNHAGETRAGRVLSEVGFILSRDPDTVRAPDVAFVRAEREAETATEGYIPGAPDIAIEVLSPNDRHGPVAAKVRDWLTAGAMAVWVVDPRARTVTVHVAEGGHTTLREGEVLAGGAAVPGFEMPVEAIFP